METITIEKWKLDYLKQYMISQTRFKVSREFLEFKEKSHQTNTKCFLKNLLCHHLIMEIIT
jgi:hypothetical protein